MMGKAKVRKQKQGNGAGLFAMAAHMIAMGAKRKPLLLLIFPLLMMGIGLATTGNTFIK